MFTSNFDELFFTWKQLSYTFFPLTSITHFIVLIYFLNYSVSGESLFFHLQYFNRSCQKRVFLNLLTFSWFNQFLNFGGYWARWTIKMRGKSFEDWLSEDNIWLYTLHQIVSLFFRPSFAFIFGSHCVWGFASDFWRILGILRRWFNILRLIFLKEIKSKFRAIFPYFAHEIFEGSEPKIINEHCEVYTRSFELFSLLNHIFKVMLKFAQKIRRVDYKWKIFKMLIEATRYGSIEIDTAEGFLSWEIKFCLKT